MLDCVFFLCFAHVFPFSFFCIMQEIGACLAQNQAVFFTPLHASFALDGHTKCVQHAPCTAEFILHPVAYDICIQAVDFLLGSHQSSREWNVSEAYSHGSLLAIMVLFSGIVCIVCNLFYTLIGVFIV